jgi:hypothetical protein
VISLTPKPVIRNMDLTSGLCQFHGVDLGFNYAKAPETQ